METREAWKGECGVGGDSLSLATKAISLSLSLSRDSKLPFCCECKKEERSGCRGWQSRGGLMVILVPSTWAKEGT